MNKTLTQFEQGQQAHADGLTYDELIADTTLHPEYRLGWLEANADMIAAHMDDGHED